MQTRVFRQDLKLLFHGETQNARIQSKYVYILAKFQLDIFKCWRFILRGLSSELFGMVCNE